MNNLNYRLIIKVELIMIAISGSVLLHLLYTYFPNVREAVALATTVKPETFTELYFTDHENLPIKTIPYKQEDIKFSIHNLEDKDMKYPYEIVTDKNGQRILLSSGTEEVKKNEYRSISKSFSTTYSDRYKVVVNLTNKKQSINFWVN